MKYFGKIKNTYNNILTENISKNNTEVKNLFKNYIKKLNENEVLKTQFMVYTNIETKVEEDPIKAAQYLQENISLFDNIPLSTISKANSLLGKGLTLSEEVFPNSELYENISNLIFMKKTATNINERMNIQTKIVDYIVGNKLIENVDVIDLPMSMVTSIMIDKLNNKYDSLNENDKNVINTIISSTNEEKEAIYTSTVRECIDLIDTKLSEANLDEKDRLLKVKDKLLRENYIVDENFIENISTLLQLTESLS